jgi:hypothetical protein
MFEIELYVILMLSILISIIGLFSFLSYFLSKPKIRKNRKYSDISKDEDNTNLI